MQIASQFAYKQSPTPVTLTRISTHTQSDDRINDGVGLSYSTSSLQTLLIDLRLMLTLALKHHYKHLQCPCLRIMYG